MLDNRVWYGKQYETCHKGSLDQIYSLVQGIDIPDIELSVVYWIPDSICQFYQVLIRNVYVAIVKGNNAQ